MFNLHAGIKFVPQGFAATLDEEKLEPRDRLCLRVPGARQRVLRRLRIEGVLYLVPHPESDSPAPHGWAVHWDERARYDT